MEIDWHGHRDRDLAIINSIAALEAGATRVHAAALGIGERVGNTPMDLLLVNLVVMGFLERDLSPLMEYCETVSEACGVPIPDNYPVVGKDAFRTATGVHAAAVIKAWKKGDRDLMDAVYSAIPGQPGRPRAANRRRPDVGQVERGVLAGAARHPVQRPDRRSRLRQGEVIDDRADRRRNTRRSLSLTLSTESDHAIRILCPCLS